MRIINESGAYGAVCLAVSRLEALLSAAVGKKGLGSAYRLTNQYLLPGSTYCRTEIAPQTWMRLPTFDLYWGPVAIGGRAYEPEIRHILNAIETPLRGRDWAFLDCGANFGYWSAIVSGPEIACPKVVAIEANPSTYSILLETRELNGRRFHAIHRAITGTDGERVLIRDFGPHAHAQSRVCASTGGQPVDSITIDGVLAGQGWMGVEAVVIKLDLEGMETSSLAGSSRLRRTIRDHIFIFEDHGKDDACLTTQAFLDHGYTVIHVGRDGSSRPITSLDAVRQIKVKPIHGYNFVAVAPDCRLEAPPYIGAASDTVRRSAALV